MATFQEVKMGKKWKCTVCGYIHEGAKPPDVCPVCGAHKYQFILYEKIPDALEKKLREAFAGESKAHIRNLAFAKKAEEDGFPQIARLFMAVAEAERVHAAEYLKYLEGVIGETEDNLKAAFESEIKAKTDIYPPFIQEAFALKREDVAWSFSRSRDVEERHAKLYKDALAAMIKEQETEYHVCQVCGYIFDAELPEECPVCRAKKENFKKMI
jgi:rubrerythrin